MQPLSTFRWTLAALTLLVGVSTGPGAHASPSTPGSAPTVRLIEASVERSRVFVSWSQDGPAREAGFAVAVPGPEMPRVRVLSQRFLEAAEGSFEPAPTEAWVVEPPLRYRRQWVLRIAVAPRIAGPDGVARRLSEIEFEILHPEGAVRSRPASGLEEESDAFLYRGAVLNDAVAADFRRYDVAERLRKVTLPIVDTFERSENWLRIEITNSGLHRIGYEDLVAALGQETVDLIRPETLRLLSASQVLQPLLPEDKTGSWKVDLPLAERAIRVEAAGAAMAPGDAILFYATGPEDWLDRYGVDAAPQEHLEHEFADRLAYWLSWERLAAPEADFPEPPLRMEELAAAVSGNAGSPRVDYRRRLHLETNIVESYGVVQDNWLWQRSIEPDVPFTVEFDLSDVVVDSGMTVFSHARAREPSKGTRGVMGLQLDVNGQSQAPLYWDWTDQTSILYGDPPLEYGYGGRPVQEGRNRLRLHSLCEVNDKDILPELVLDFFYVAHRRLLRAETGRLEWRVFEDEVPIAAPRAFAVEDPDGNWGAEPILLDTTDPFRPRWLTGASSSDGGRTLQFEVDLEAEQARHFLVSGRDALLAPDRLSARRPRRLRAEVRRPDGEGGVGYDMVVLHPASMQNAAEALVDLRREHLSDHNNPRVTSVDLQDVYDQFGHGVKEPTAIRNYLKFLYEVDGRLEYAVFLGDASRDYRNRQGRDPDSNEMDRCPTFIQTQWPYETHGERVPYAADDWMGSFDNPRLDPPSLIYIDLPELGLGRIPAGDLSEAQQMVQRIVRYETEPAAGPWRNIFLLAADDEIALANPGARETDHIDQAELIDNAMLPSELDVDKLYLTEYPTVPGTRAKPTARESMRQRWTEGRLVVHYIGHGSPTQLADEALFKIQDVASLGNGERLPLFLAFSCDVSIFDSPTTKSMSEQLVLSPSGGAIATIAATQVTYITSNENLTNAFYPRLYPDDLLARSQPLGRALTQAKVSVPNATTSPFTQHNNQKYVVLGDPALRLQSPRAQVELSGDLATAILSGQIQSLAGRIVLGGEVQEQHVGRYYLAVTESADSTTYYIDRGDTLPPTPLPYVLAGSTFFEGTGLFGGGSAGVEVPTPATMRFGEDGRVRLLLESDAEMFVGTLDPLAVRREAIASDDREGPAIQLGFENEARQVTPGARLRATIADPSGINVLRSVPANSLLLELDDGGIQFDVTDRFQLDDGSYTQGSLVYELPEEISPGEHTLALTAGDMLGNVSRQEIAFTVIAAGGKEIAGHAVFPNPFADEARLVVELTSPVGVANDLSVTIYTTDGNPIRRIRRELRGSGTLVIPWDGRDRRGDEVANGVYLYTLRATFGGDPPITEVTTGRIVKMR